MPSGGTSNYQTQQIGYLTMKCFQNIP